MIITINFPVFRNLFPITARRTNDVPNPTYTFLGLSERPPYDAREPNITPDARDGKLSFYYKISYYIVYN